MLDQLRGQPIRRVEIVEDTTALLSSSGAPVIACQAYTYDAPPADGRPILAVSSELDDGQTPMAICLFDTGALLTADGRPIHAVMLFDAAGAPDAGEPGFAFDFVTDTYTVEGSTVGLGDLTYTRTGVVSFANSDNSISSFAANAIPVTDQGLQLFGALTNLAPNPKAFNLWTTFNGGSASANAANGPNGVAEAETVTFGAAADSQVYQQGLGVASSHLHYEVWLRHATATKDVRLQLWPGGASYDSNFTVTTTWQRRQYSIGNSTDRVALVNASGGGAGTVIAWGASLYSNDVPFPTSNWPIVLDGACGVPSLSFALTNGDYRLTYTFDDDSTQEVSATASGGTLTLPHCFPLGLVRPHVKSIVGVAETAGVPRLVGRKMMKLVTGGANTVVPLTTLEGGLSTTAATGDLVLAFIGTGHVLAVPTMQTAGYTQLVDNLSGNDNDDSMLDVHRKLMGGTPDTTVEVYGGGSPGSVIVEVWRGVDQTTPIDVATVTATGIDGTPPNFASITPVTTGAVLVGGVVQAVDGAIPAFTSSEFVLFQRVGFPGTGGNDNHRMAVGSRRWTGGAFDAAAFGGGSVGASAAWSAAIVALRPAA